MSNGLITGVGAGSTTIHAKRRSTGATVDIPVTVTGTASPLDTTSYDATTGAGIGGSTGTPLVWDSAKRYANDAAFRSSIAYYGTGSGISLSPYTDNSLKGTAPNNSTALYNDGRYPDLSLWQNAVQYNGDPMLRFEVRGVNLPSESPTCEFSSSLPAGTTEVWVWARRRWQNGFTVVGDADDTNGGYTWNHTGVGGSPQGLSFKIGPASGGSSGSLRLETDGTNLFFQDNPNGSGIPETNSGALLGTEWTDDGVYDYLVRAEKVLGANGHYYEAETFWRRKCGSGAPYVRVGRRLTGDSGSTTAATFQGVGGTSLNYNWSRLTSLFYYLAAWAAFNGSGGADPFGVIAQDAATTPEAITLGAVSGQTSSTATFPVTMARFGRYLRPVVDGVELAAQEYAIPLETLEDATISRTVTGLSAGAHSVKYRLYNANKTAYAETGAQAVTI